MHTEPVIQQVKVDLIIPNRFQPRLVFDERGLNELADSIKEYGIIQPLVLRKLDDKYEIIAGERRYKAATIAGLTEVPAIINNLDDNQSAEVALIENIQRRDLSSIEEAKSYRKILDKGYLTQDQLAKRLGISQAAIANKLRLLNLDPIVQDALMSQKISERHARSLLQLENLEEQKRMLDRIMNERLTVRQLDDEIKLIVNPGSTSENLNPIVNFEQIETAKFDLTGDTNNVFNSLSAVDNPLQPDQSDTMAIQELPIETLDLNEPEQDLDEKKANSVDILANVTNKILSAFDQNKFPSLEDEVVNLNVDSELNSPTDDISEHIVPENDDLSQPEPIQPVAVVNQEVVEKKKINLGDLQSVSIAYHELESEVKKVGYNITTEEFDFEDLYQIIVKIDKQTEN